MRQENLIAVFCERRSKNPETVAAQRLWRCIFFVNERHAGAKSALLRYFFAKMPSAPFPCPSSLNRSRCAAVGGSAALRMRPTPCGCCAGLRFGFWCKPDGCLFLVPQSTLERSPFCSGFYRSQQPRSPKRPRTSGFFHI